MVDLGLCYIGKIITLEIIPNADFLLSATVVCGSGGKWKGVVRKWDFEVGSPCIVYLPDSIILPNEEMKFMEAHKWRVRMCKFRGSPSEVVIMPYKGDEPIGTDMTLKLGVTKFFKPIPPNLAGEQIGYFPGFIPKTDESNYQRNGELVQQLTGRPYFITEKCDGSSTTAFNWKGHFGVCSRNLELKETEHNGFWKMANMYNLREKLPEDYALQWETCGPSIQSNPMGLDEMQPFAFNVFNIERQSYLPFIEFYDFCRALNFPTAKLLKIGESFNPKNVSTLGEGTFSTNCNQREGVVVRSQHLFNGAPISFKVINLNYER